MEPHPVRTRPDAARRPRRWVGFFLVLAALAAAAVTVPIVYNLSLQLAPEQLAQARARWQAHGPRDYDLRYEEKVTRGKQTEAYEYLVQVRGGRVVLVACNGEVLLLDPLAGFAAGPAVRALPPEKASGYGVEALFDGIEAALRRDAEAGVRAYATATFAGGDGHPVRYVHRNRQAGERVEWNGKLTPVPGGATSPPAER
jgi:hypothetical protein